MLRSHLSSKNLVRQFKSMELDGESYWTQLAEKEWLRKSTKARKVRQEVVKTEIWDVLEKEDFGFRSLHLLENLQLLEKYVCLVIY